MSMKETLAKLSEALGTSIDGPKTVTMSQTEFLAYAKDQVEKAKKEDEEKAKKRLDHLRSTVNVLQKGAWEGSNDKVSVEMYTDPGQEVSTETETALDAAAGKGTQADASFAAPEGAQSFAKTMENLSNAMAQIAPAQTMATDAVNNAAPPPEPTSNELPGFWPLDMNTKPFREEGIAKSADKDGWGSDPWAAAR
ncbi:MAG: hypothetical protein EPO42_14380 [Gallionellaceae bacterium]|nr:MAG: hypothetical protein EPO42_14380 [Gallionellaceae bacterium]